MGGRRQSGISEGNDQFKGFGKRLGEREKWEVAGIGDCFGFIE
jgi:hypothetical protein